LVLVESERLPKGALARLALRPEAVVQASRRALVRLQKAVRLAKGLRLNERELRHLLTHPSDFDGASLSTLPTATTDDTTSQRLFAQFVRWTSYVSLRQRLCHGRDDLITLFVAARQTLSALPGTTPEQQRAAFFASLCEAFATLTGNVPATVALAAATLGMTARASSADPLLAEAPAFFDERGLTRLYEAMRLFSQLGVPPDLGATFIHPAPTAELAEAMLAERRRQTTAAGWRTRAQPIFDELRRLQRDALVAYLFNSPALAPYLGNSEGGDALNQLYEYFLIDPGTEPVVLTSRLRLAMSAVQLFIQRCFLNLEAAVPPSATDSSQWEWMQQYRVWQANLKIFLYPENWLEPEFRDDKTALYSAFERSIAQGDITDDMAEDVFFAYLDGLEGLARLELISMYREEPHDDPASTVVHVVGRTFALPRKHYYRSFAHGMWTPWEPVSAQIQSEQVAIAIWRGRRFLFWASFMDSTRNADHASALVGSVANQPLNETTPHQISAQLSWSEYSQGKWSAPMSSEFSPPVDSHTRLDPKAIFIHVSKEPNDSAIRINLWSGYSLMVWFGFRMANRHSKPSVVEWEPMLMPPYAPLLQIDPTRYLSSSASLNVRYEERPGFGLTQHPILTQATDYSLLVNGTSSPWRTDASEALQSELFFADAANTFFIQPRIGVVSLLSYAGWAISMARAEATAIIPDQVSNRLAQVVPRPGGGPNPAAEAGDTDPAARFEPRLDQDWIAAGDATVIYGGARIARTGVMTEGTFSNRVVAG